MRPRFQELTQRFVVGGRLAMLSEVNKETGACVEQASIPRLTFKSFVENGQRTVQVALESLGMPKP